MSNSHTFSIPSYPSTKWARISRGSGEVPNFLEFASGIFEMDMTSSGSRSYQGFIRPFALEPRSGCKDMSMGVAGY